MKSTYRKLLFIFLILLVISCNFASSLTPTAEGNSTPEITPSQTVEITPSQTALESTPENSTNFQSSLTTFPGFTSIQLPTTRIADNPSALTELAYWQNGSFIGEAELSRNGNIIAIATSIGVYIYSAKTFEQYQFIEQYDIYDISLAPNGDFVALTDRTTIQIYDTNTTELVKTIPLQG